MSHTAIFAEVNFFIAAARFLAATLAFADDPWTTAGSAHWLAVTAATRFVRNFVVHNLIIPTAVYDHQKMPREAFFSLL